MSRYINIDKVLSELCLSHKDIIYIDKNETAERIRKIPSIDIEPKRGEWKIEETESVWGKGYMLTCSECGDTFRVTESALSHEHFCPNCGADMREREGE